MFEAVEQRQMLGHTPLRKCGSTTKLPSSAEPERCAASLRLLHLPLQNMSSKGVERIETAEGDDFDPNTQEAMTTTPAAEGKKPNTVAAVWQVSFDQRAVVLL
jgi:molecular chaperone GrpE (heat shock protein)